MTIRHFLIYTDAPQFLYLVELLHTVLAPQESNFNSIFFSKNLPGVYVAGVDIFILSPIGPTFLIDDLELEILFGSGVFDTSVAMN